MSDFEPGEQKVVQDPLTEKIVGLEVEAGEPMMARFVPTDPDLMPVSILRAPDVHSIRRDGRDKWQTTYHALTPGAQPGEPRMLEISLDARINPDTGLLTDREWQGQHLHLPLLQEALANALGKESGSYDGELSVGVKPGPDGQLLLYINDPTDGENDRPRQRTISLNEHPDPKSVVEAIRRSKTEAMQVAEEKKQAADAERRREEDAAAKAANAQAAAEAEEVTERDASIANVRSVLEGLNDI